MSTTDSTVSVVHDPACKRKNSKEFNPPMMRIVLLGKDVSTNSRVGNLMLGRSAFDSEAPPDDHQIERVRGKDMMIINCPHLLQLNLSYHQIIQTVRECVDLSHPGPHVILLIFKHDECSREDQERLEMILNSFSDGVYEHTLVLTTHSEEQTDVNDIIKEIIKKCLNKHYRLEGNSTPDELKDKFKNIVKSNDGRYLIDDEYEELQFHTLKQQTDERECVKLNVVLCGSDRKLKISILKLMMKESSRRSVMRSDYMRREMEVCGRLISLMKLPALTQLSEDEVMRQTLHCLSLCDPGVHVFLLIIPDDPLTDEDKSEMKKIHKIFSSKIKIHIMVLIMQKSEDTTAELNEATQSDIKHYAGQCHVFGPNTHVSTLIERVEQMVEDNRGASFSTQTFLDEQMKKKSHLRETQTESHDPPEIRDDMRIVLLGKTGVGKSATGNTILNRQAFISEESFESVTSECQKHTAEINNRLITVIDTPGLFDTERSHEEIKREMMNCISMILPGPHVFLLLVSLGRFTQEESTSVKIIQEMFGENSLMFTMVLFTRGDQLRNKTIEECLGKPGSGIRNLIEECGNRYHVFNNNLTEDQTQVSLLLEKIDDMVKANGGSYYSSKIFKEMQQEKHEQQMKKLMEKIEELSREKEEERERMKMVMEEERQSHEREMNKRQEEFREREEKYKREIKEKEEQERQMRDEMRKEREEHERQKREDNEKMREREREMWAEYNQRLKQEREETQRENKKIRQEKEKIEREKEDLQLRHEEEIKRLTKHTEEEKLNQDKEKKKREEVYKREINEKDEYLREVRREREIFKNDAEEVKKENKNLQMKYETQTDKLMNTIENHERERKRREDEFREKEERYNREIKEKEEQERQMRDEMRREREEHERQKQEERQSREEDKKEKQIYVEQCERLKCEMNEIMKEKGRIEREKEDQLEEFEKRIKEERNMREEQEKIFEDKLKLMKEENEDELKRKTTEMIEKHEREKEDQLEEFEKRIKEERNMREEQEKRYEDKLKLMKEENEDELKRRTTEMIEKHEREKEDQLEEFEKRIKEERNMREKQEKRYEDKLKLMKEENEEELKRRTTEMIEKHEREKEDQLEEFEKRIQEERNMREEQEKRYEDKLKLMKEENEEELKRRTTEMTEKHEREKEEMKICSQSLHTSLQDFGTAGVRPDEHLQQDKTEQIQHLFQKLHLSDRHQNKLRASDVLQISVHSLQSHESCAEEELVEIYLQKLLMMNYRARYIKTRDTNVQHHTQQTDKDSLEEEDFFADLSLSYMETSKPDPVHPLDVQMSVFYCADSFLKQLMVTKLSQCQFALPLLVPHPFTQQIEFPLWTFRQIKKSWKMRNTNNEIISKVQPVYKAETPMVSFFRFGSVSSSKSQLMNNLINEKHNTFFHRNCPGSSRTRLLMDGVVEIAWYCPSGKDTDKFTDCVAFCNLHGDAGVHEKQLQILTQMSSVNVVLLPKLDRNDKNMIKIQNLYRDKKPLIFLFTEDESALTETKKGKYKIGLKYRNQSDVSEDLRRVINDCLSSSASVSMFRLEDLSKHSDIRVDEEDDEDCRRGREAAEQMMSLLKNKRLSAIKESFLPCQGKLWHLWCQKNKQLHRPQGDEIDQEIYRTRTEMINIREDQCKCNMSDFMKFFIVQMDSSVVNVNIYFLKWLRIFLNKLTSADLPAIHQKYDEKWSTISKLKEQNDKPKLKKEETELERISEDLQASVFGLEHIMREIGQIYESCSSVKKNKTDLQFNFSSLPSLAAEMMICGFPLELMDGDADHVPLIWITAVLDELIQKLGDQRVFVLSVLGLQSSGKSTMLNAMFGLQFAVSAGRCTRGAFMQLIRLSEEMKDQLKFDYILVVDTEGLRALVLAGRSIRHHDNELATFVVGLGNLTLINIFGENPAEMQDILQIVVQAFLRMKKVRLNPSCMFVHQNVSDITAGDKNMEGRRRLLQTLDEMTKLAAKDEFCDAECFSDVINFDVCNDVKYFAQLLEGSPPMAPPNPNYCENIQELKKTIISKASKSDGMKLTHLRERIKDLWEALLNERFVFHFRNSLEILAYRRLETEYSKWTWSLRSAMLEIENKLQNKIENEAIYEIKVSDIQRELKEKSEEVKNSMSEFFEKATDRDILIQWKISFEIKIKDLEDNIVRETKRKLNVILQQRALKRKLDDERTQHENTLLEKSKELALKLKDKTNNEEILKREFDLFWEKWMKKISTDTPPIKDIDILRDVKEILSDIYASFPVDTRKNICDIFTVQSYSDYVQLKKSRGITGHFKNVYKAMLVSVISKEDETQIRNLTFNVSDETVKMIQSFNISKFGYNISYIHQLTDYIKTRITEYEEESVKYEFKNEFFIDLVFSILKRANTIIIDQHRMFREVNDPVLYLEKKRDEYYRIFKKYCQGATS